MLSEEDIVSLRWTLESIYPSEVKVFSKIVSGKTYELTFYGESNKPSPQIVIYSVHYDIDEKRQTVVYFRGKCQDKTTLELLMYLLEI